MLNAHMKCINIPFLWRKFFLNNANNRYYVYNYCNRPFNNIHRHCRESYLYINTNGGDIRLLNDEMNTYGAYW